MKTILKTHITFEKEYVSGIATETRTVYSHPILDLSYHVRPFEESETDSLLKESGFEIVEDPIADPASSGLMRPKEIVNFFKKNHYKLHY